jgi:hypothetical protein
MIIPLIFVAIGLIALLLLVYLFVGRIFLHGTLNELVTQLRPVDVNAFRNLIDESERQYLREHLPAQEFRSIHRQRMLSAVEYAWAAARNAGILVRFAEAAKQDPDPEVVTAAANLQENALRVRLYALRAVPRLCLSMMVPYLNHAPQSLAEQYEVITRQMVTLRCLRSPVRGL